MSYQHFARIRPIVGASLAQRTVALAGFPAAAPLVALLAASGVGRWLWDRAAPPELLAELDARHGGALALAARLVASWRPVDAGQADLVIAVGDSPAAAAAADAAWRAGAPLLRIGAAPGGRCRVSLALPGEQPPPPAALPGPELGDWGWRTAAPLAAGLARALLLRDTPFARADLAELWAAGVRVWLGGGPADPLLTEVGAAEWPGPAAGNAQGRAFATPAGRRGTLLVAGLGSLGSVALEHLQGAAAGLVLADPDTVEPANPARQWFDLADIGRPKAAALADRLRRLHPALPVVALGAALDDEEALAALIADHGVSGGLVATGTDADFAIARALRAAGLPHVVGRCYGRAQFWEAMLIDGARGPALDDLRGHLVAGPAAPPTPEQRAAYSDAGALEAEPATLVESGWAAAWLARLTRQLLAPPALRERWLLDLLAAEAVCLIGGVGSQPTPAGPAYRVALPGQIHAWRRGEIRGAGR